jgi:hypothetical protein
MRGSRQSLQGRKNALDEESVLAINGVENRLQKSLRGGQPSRRRTRCLIDSQEEGVKSAKSDGEVIERLAKF